MDTMGTMWIVLTFYVIISGDIRVFPFVAFLLWLAYLIRKRHS